MSFNQRQSITLDTASQISAVTQARDPDFATDCQQRAQFEFPVPSTDHGPSVVVVTWISGAGGYEA